MIRPHNPTRNRSLAAALLAAMLAVSHSAKAASDTWVGTTDATWATSSNWLAAGVVPGTGDTATFNGAGNGNTVIDLGSGVTLGALLFDTSSAAAYTIGSGGAGSQTLTLGTVGNAITMNSTVANNELVNANLALATTGTYTFTNSSTTNTLTIAGGISASTTGTKVLSVTGAGNTAISGAIAAGSGVVNFVKLGTGTLTLSGGGDFGAAGITTYGGTASAVLLGGETVISSGAYTSAGELTVGGVLSTGGTGVNTKLTMNGGSLTINGTGYLSLGRGNGTGSVSSDIVLNNSAAITAANFSAGFNNGSTSNLPKGTFTLNGSSIFTISGNGVYVLGESNGTQGMTMTLNDSSQLIASGTGIKYIGGYNGVGGTGTLTLNTGTVNFGSGITYVGYKAGTGVLNINGGTYTSTGEMRLSGSEANGAFGGSGTVNITGGTTSIGSLTAARGNNNTFTGTGTINVSAGTVTIGTSGDTILGYAGNADLGKLSISGGTVNIGTTTARTVYLGYYDTSKGQIDVTGGALNLNTNSSIKFTPGNTSTAGTNVINQSGGTVTFYSDNGTTVGGTGVLDMASSGAAASNNTYNLNGGTLTANQVKSTILTNTRTFNFNGGTLKAASSTYASTFFNLGTGGTARANVRNGGALIDTNGFDVTVAQALLHSNVGGDLATDGGLTKSGAGTLTLSGTNTFTGAATVNVGTLATGSTGTFGAGNVNVAASAALTFGNNASIGDLSTLTFASTSTINLNFTGAETLGAVYNSISSTYLADGTYDAAGLNSYFGGISAFTGTGSITVSAVPEPATYAVVAGLGVLALAAYRRRRNA